VAIGVPLVFFLVFERWFLFLLPKGPHRAAARLSEPRRRDVSLSHASRNHHG
jgi:hypothetical protein